MVNKSILCGTLTKAPELIRGFCKFTLSITEEYLNKDKQLKSITTNHPITMAGKPAESFCENAKAYDTIMIEGKLTLNKYKDSHGIDVAEYRTFGQNYSIIHRPIRTEDSFNK